MLERREKTSARLLKQTTITAVASFALLGFVVVGSLVELISFVDNFGRAGRQEKLVLLFGSHIPAYDLLEPK